MNAQLSYFIRSGYHRGPRLAAFVVFCPSKIGSLVFCPPGRGGIDSAYNVAAFLGILQSEKS